MNSQRRRPGIRAILGALVSLSLLCPLRAPSLAGKGDRLPYELGVKVSYGHPIGPESLRDELQRMLVNYLGRSGCFGELSLIREESESDADLILDILLDDYREEHEYGMSIAALNSPDILPEQKQNQVAVISAFVEIDLRERGAPAPARSRRHKQVIAHRPQFDEDAEYEARFRFLDDTARYARDFVCRGSDKKLTKEIERARETP
jgi:hypothetical protein